MTVTVTVDATWRMSRVELIAPHSPTGMVYGYGEVLLQEPDKPSEGASILRTRHPLSPAPASIEESKTYGTMVVAPTMRGVGSVLNDTVEVDGVKITFAAVMEALSLFMDKWRVEDQNPKPPPEESASA
jgi:hypothetical protein